LVLLQVGMAGEMVAGTGRAAAEVEEELVAAKAEATVDTMAVAAAVDMRRIAIVTRGRTTVHSASTARYRSLGMPCSSLGRSGLLLECSSRL